MHRIKDFFCNKLKVEFLLLSIILLTLAYASINLISGKRVLIGDLEIWYSLYHYFAESIYNGTIALWNPYMNGGEPFWPLINMTRLLDPLNILFILIGKIFNIQIFRLYHIYQLCCIIISLSGAYLVFKHTFAKRIQSDKKNIIFLIALFISFANVSFTFQLTDTVRDDFYVLPYILYFLIRLIEEKDIKWYLFAVYSLGLFIGSTTYHFIYGAFFLFLFILVVIIQNPRIALPVCYNYFKKYKIQIAVSFIYLSILCLPMIVTYMGMTNLYPIGRTGLDRPLFEKGMLAGVFSTSYADNMKTSCYVSPAYLITRILEFPCFYKDYIFYKYQAEVFVPLFFIGLIFGKDKWKYNFIIVLLVSIFMTLGADTIVHKYLCAIFSPLKLLRNPIYIIYYVFFAYTYFLILGFSVVLNLIDKLGSRRKKVLQNVLWLTACILVFIFLIEFAKGKSFNTSTIIADAYIPDFNKNSVDFKFIDKRLFALPRPGYYLYDPILYKKDAALTMLAAAPDGKNPDDMPYFKAWNSLKVTNRFDACYGIRTFFWTPYYYDIYRLGENDIDVFNELMGVNQNIIDFKENIVVMNNTEINNLILQTTGKELKNILSKAAIIDKLPIQRDGFNIITSADYNFSNSPNNKTGFSYEMLSYKPDNISLAVKADRNGFLVFRDGYDKDWAAYVDGKRREIYRTNIGFKGLFLLKGTHTVKFQYVPIFYLCAFYSFIFFSFVIPLGILYFNRKTSSSFKPSNNNHKMPAKLNIPAPF